MSQNSSKAVGRQYVGLRGQLSYEDRLRAFHSRPAINDDQTAGSILKCWSEWASACDNLGSGSQGGPEHAQQVNIRQHIYRLGLAPRTASEGSSSTAAAAAAAAVAASVSLALATACVLSHPHGSMIRSTNGVIDLRPRSQFDDAHFAGTTSMTWPSARETPPADHQSPSFVERAHELPCRGSTLALLATDRASLDAAAAQLIRRGYSVSFLLHMSPASFNSQRKHHNQSDSSSSSSSSSVQEAGWVPSSRPLWRPSECLRRLVPMAEAAVSPNFVRGGDSLAIDLGCGGGREAMFLLQRGWRVLAVDIHDDRRFQTILKSLGRPPAHWRGNGFGDRCHYRQLDLEADEEGVKVLLTKECAAFGGGASCRPAAHGNDDAGNDSSPSPSSSSSTAAATAAAAAAAQLVWVGRYLHRPLLPIIRDHLVAPGGAVIYHTFCKGCEKFGRPKKDRFLLRPGELADVFKGWQVVMDATLPISDGRPCSYFCAVKPTADVSAALRALEQ